MVATTNRPDAPSDTSATRFVADHLVVSADLPVMSPGIIDVAGDTVVWSGPASEAPSFEGVPNRLAGLVAPGLVNAHAHTPMLLLRGTGEGLPTDRWLVEVMWPREGRLIADDVAWAMRSGAAELLGNGITTTNEMYFYGEEVAAAAQTAGLRCIVTPPLIESDDLTRFGDLTEQLGEISALRARWADRPLVDVGLGPHSAYGLSRDALAEIADVVAADPMLVHVHVGEQPHEGDGVLEATGLTVPAYLDALGLLGRNTIAAHAVWMTPDDIELFADRGVSVAHCPASNGRHASGIAPVGQMIAAGITVGLGTDGPASHDRLDMFAEMRAATWLARLAMMDASAMPARRVLAMATSGAADAIGRPDLGRLTPGSRADMIRVDTDGQSFDPVLDEEQLIERFVWAGSPETVRDVWVGGRQVVADRRCLTVDAREARREVVARARRLADAP